jgi:hypothetical protein
MVTLTPEQISRIQAQERQAQEAQRERRAAPEEDRSTGLEHLPINFLCGDINAQFAAFLQAQAEQAASQSARCAAATPAEAAPEALAPAEPGVAGRKNTEVSRDASALGAISSASTMSAESVPEVGKKAQGAEAQPCAVEEAKSSVPEAAEPAGGEVEKKAKTCAQLPAPARASPVPGCVDPHPGQHDAEAVQPGARGKREELRAQTNSTRLTGWEVVAHLLLPPGVQGSAPLTRKAQAHRLPVRQTLQTV